MPVTKIVTLKSELMAQLEAVLDKNVNGEDYTSYVQLSINQNFFCFSKPNKFFNNYLVVLYAGTIGRP